MTDIQFPHEKLRAVSVMFHPQLASKSGGVSVTGIEQVVQSSAGRWGASLGFEVGHGFAQVDAISRDADSVLAWRAIVGLLEGRSNNLLIGPYDRLNTPAAIAGTSYGGASLHDDDTPFSDDSEYEQAETPAVVAAAHAIGATSMTIDMDAGHVTEAGQYFSILDRLYLIRLATEVSAGRYTLGVWPPARDAVTAAHVVVRLAADFDRPNCRMRLARDDAMQLSMRALYRGSPSADLVEAP